MTKYIFTVYTIIYLYYYITYTYYLIKTLKFQFSKQTGKRGGEGKNGGLKYKKQWQLASFAKSSKSAKILSNKSR